nr:hypothetical protein BaRGS_035195 [Batillaria attramentaria]
MFQLHGNPADYAWGAGGLDTIITQLESSGPPPAEADKIDALPSVTITQEQVAMVLQCSICMEDFTLEEEAKRLPCEHHYHKDCIIRWLEMLLFRIHYVGITGLTESILHTLLEWQDGVELVLDILHLLFELLFQSI